MSTETILSISIVLFGVMSGTYFAFSIIVMPVFKQLPVDVASNVMKKINSDILKSIFMLIFWLSTLSAVFLIVSSTNWLMVVSGAVYIAGMFCVTALCNVPLNKQLADAVTKNMDEVWTHYLKYWTAWNHIRTLCSFISFALSVVALVFYDF